MNFTNAVKSFWTNYTNFKGRASRSEFWFALLFIALVNIIISFISEPLGLTTTLTDGTAISLLSLGWLAAYIVPWLAITVRRLHDSGKSGWFFFIIFLPLAGPIIHFVFLLLKSTPGENKYGMPADHIMQQNGDSGQVFGE